MAAAGFTYVDLVKRNPRCAKVAPEELTLFTGPERPGLCEQHGEDFIDHQMQVWTS